MAEDRRSEPRVGERVPYVVVRGMPGTPLFRLIHQPLDVLNNPRLRLNATYYITKLVLPALDRVMSLQGVDVFSWYRDLPRFENLQFSSVSNFTEAPGEISRNSKKVIL